MRKKGGSSDVGTSVAFGRAKRCRRETNIDGGGGQIIRKEVKEVKKVKEAKEVQEKRDSSLRGLRSE
jgi:hypothetical protein